MSSLGKSYANYLVYYFLSMVCNGTLRNHIVSEIDRNVVLQKHEFMLDDFLGKMNNQAEGFMRKFLGDDELECKVEFKSLKRKRSVLFELRKIEVENPNKKGLTDNPLSHAHQPYELCIDSSPRIQLPSLEYAQFYIEREIQLLFLGEFIYRAVILPPGRGAFAGENFSVKSEVASSMNMYNNFFRDYDFGLNPRIQVKREGDDDLSSRLLRLTSGGRLISIEGKQFLQLDETKKIALSAGASSVKDLSPWLFYLKNHRIMPCAFCLEEPEAHQHPSITVQIADVMAIAMHRRGASLIHLTTHSDYLIQRFNQLIKLGSIRRKNRELFRHICKERKLDPYAYLDAKDVHAYYFSKNEKGKTVVETLQVTDDGIPMKSFFDVVSDLGEREEYINAAIYRMNKEQV